MPGTNLKRVLLIEKCSHLFLFLVFCFLVSSPSWAMDAFDDEQLIGLTIKIEPHEARLMKAEWRVSQESWVSSWCASDQALAVEPGEYVLEFSSVVGWREPQADIINVDSEDQLITYQYFHQPESHPWYLNVNASGENDGSSWSDAFTDLQTGIDTVFGVGGGELWVAAGSYTGEGFSGVEIKEGVCLYGGFSGTEVRRHERDWDLNPTIIDGQNTRRCLTGADAAVFDGFVIKNGNSLSSAGMENNHCSPIVRNCLFTRNLSFPQSVSGGGTVSNLGGSLAFFENCQFVDNRVESFSRGVQGGGVINYSSSVTYINCLFEGNEVSNDATIAYGGAMYNYNSQTTVLNCQFIGNVANSDWMNGYGGAIYSRKSDGTMIRNCLFRGNSVTGYGGDGGALYSKDESLDIRGCIFDDNTAGNEGGALFAFSSSLVIENCIFQGNTSETKVACCMMGIGDGSLRMVHSTLVDNKTGYSDSMFKLDSTYGMTVQSCIFWRNGIIVDPDSEGQHEFIYSCLNGFPDSEGNIDVDPMLMSALRGDYRLLASSPCIDTGRPEGITPIDIRGFPRPFGDWNDMGAYEYWDDSIRWEITPVVLGQMPPVEESDFNKDGCVDAVDLMVY